MITHLKVSALLFHMPLRKTASGFSNLLDLLKIGALSPSIVSTILLSLLFTDWSADKLDGCVCTAMHL